MATTWQQTDFRFRADDGSQSGASWLAAANTNITPTVRNTDYKFRIRIAVKETGTTAATFTGRLYIAKNGGSYAQASNSATTGCKVVDSANLTDDAATTQQLSSGTFVAGKVDDSTGQCTATGSIAQNSVTEHEFMLQLTFSQLSNGDYFDFRIRNSTTTLSTYTYTGRVTVTKDTVPTITLNSPADAATASNRRPVFDFTGTDANSDDIRYQIQIDTSSGFNSVVSDPVLVAHTHAKASGGSISTSGIDTTGATLIVLGFAYDGSTPTPTDNYNNTWTALTAKLDNFWYAQLFYCVNPTVGTGHTFSDAHSSRSMTVSAFSGAGAYDKESAGATSGSATIQPGSITPTSNKSLIIAFVGENDIFTSMSIDGGFTITDSEEFVSGNNYGSSSAYLIQTTAAAVNPTWTRTDNPTHGQIAVMAAFAPASSPLISKVSGTDAGFVNPDTGADTDPFTSGENIQYTPQEDLPISTLYWRVRPTDPSGTNSWGTWPTARSITIPNTTPTITLNSPTDASSTSNRRPVFDFTGTDVDGNAIRYQIQIDTSATFDSQLGAENVINSFVPGGFSQENILYTGSYTAEGQTFLCSTTCVLTKAAVYLKRLGTPTGNGSMQLFALTGGVDTAPTGSALATSDSLDVSTLSNTGYGNITEVQFTDNYTIQAGTAYWIGFVWSGGDVSNCVYVGVASADGSAEGVECLRNGATWTPDSNHDVPYKIWGRIKAPLLNKVSGTDAGFANPDTGGDTDPFNSGENIQYTPQADLPISTLYWRVRPTDPTGSNTYGSWPTARSITITSSGTDWSATGNITAGSIVGTLIRDSSILGNITAGSIVGTLIRDSSILGNITAGSIVGTLIRDSSINSQISITGYTGTVVSDKSVVANIDFRITYVCNIFKDCFLQGSINSGIGYSASVIADKSIVGDIDAETLWYGNITIDQLVGQELFVSGSINTQTEYVLNITKDSVINGSISISGYNGNIVRDSVINGSISISGYNGTITRDSGTNAAITISGYNGTITRDSGTNAAITILGYTGTLIKDSSLVGNIDLINVFDVKIVSDISISGNIDAQTIWFAEFAIDSYLIISTVTIMAYMASEIQVLNYIEGSNTITDYINSIMEIS